MYVYNIIKESDLSLKMLDSSILEFKKTKDFVDFEGETHEDLRVHGQAKKVGNGEKSTFGYTRTKEGVSYWVLPYPENTILGTERVEGGEVVSKTYTQNELLEFGFDVEEIELI